MPGIWPRDKADVGLVHSLPQPAHGWGSQCLQGEVKWHPVGTGKWSRQGQWESSPHRIARGRGQVTRAWDGRCSGQAPQEFSAALDGVGGHFQADLLLKHTRQGSQGKVLGQLQRVETNVY